MAQQNSEKSQIDQMAILFDKDGDEVSHMKTVHELRQQEEFTEHIQTMKSGN